MGSDAIVYQSAYIWLGSPLNGSCISTEGVTVGNIQIDKYWKSMPSLKPVSEDMQHPFYLNQLAASRSLRPVQTEEVN